MNSAAQYTKDELEIVWQQFVAVHAKSQEAFDASIRTLAAGGVAVTVSIATALHTFGDKGTAAVGSFLFSLGVNLTSYVTAQLDMKERIRRLQQGRHNEIAGTGWTGATTILNTIAGIALIAGGALLAWFVASRGGEVT